MNNNQNMCMDVAGGQVKDGAIVQVWNCNGLQGQSWKWCSDGRIVSELDERFCLDVPGGDPSKASDLQTWTCNGQGGQYWEYDQKTMAIYPANTGEKMCVDTEHGSTSGGTHVNLYNCVPGSGQAWLAGGAHLALNSTHEYTVV